MPHLEDACAASALVGQGLLRDQEGEWPPWEVLHPSLNPFSSLPWGQAPHLSSSGHCSVLVCPLRLTPQQPCLQGPHGTTEQVSLRGMVVSHRCSGTQNSPAERPNSAIHLLRREVALAFTSAEDTHTQGHFTPHYVRRTYGSF